MLGFLQQRSEGIQQYVETVTETNQRKSFRCFCRLCGYFHCSAGALPASHFSWFKHKPYTCLRLPEFLHYFSDFYLETGLKYGTKACCGYGGGDYNFDPRVYCGNSKEINGRKVTATACNDPYNYVSWDGIHASEAANKLTTFAILNGSYSDPPFPFQEHCDLQPIH